MQVAARATNAEEAESKRQYDEVLARHANPDGTSRPILRLAQRGDLGSRGFRWARRRDRQRFGQNIVRGAKSLLDQVCDGQCRHVLRRERGHSLPNLRPGRSEALGIRDLGSEAYHAKAYGFAEFF